jgi:hypothetical protein
MQPVDFTYFFITLFLSLAGLIKWKYRKDDLAARLNRGLKGYVQTGSPARARSIPHFVVREDAAAPQDGADDLIVA